jgi:mycofactocin system glycosyltransferase
LPVPAGWRLRPARGLKSGHDGEVLLGGSPLRILTLSGRGAAVVRRLLAGQPASEDIAERLLARRLLDAGLAQPDPPCRPHSAAEATIVIPVYGDAPGLEECLAPLTGGSPVIVVDDGSPDGAGIEAVADRFGARYVRHPHNRGAGAARNTGLELAATPFVAFVDSDCVPPVGFPRELLDHLDDPAVALVAPRIVSSEVLNGCIAAYERCHSILDLGPHPSLVRPYGFVWYVPSAAMVARRDALRGGFDERLELGEDVDLVWRLHEAGWQIRFEPRTVVQHRDRTSPLAWYRRRVAYNQSVVPLLARHPGHLPTLFVSPVGALCWGATLAGCWPALIGLAAVRALRMRRTLGGRVPGSTEWAARAGVEATVHEGRQLARAVAGPWAPAAVAAMCLARRPRRRRLGVRLGALLAGGIAADWVDDRPRLNPLIYGALRLAEESARGAGIWRACVRARDFRALAPRRPPHPSRR